MQFVTNVPGYVCMLCTVQGDAGVQVAGQGTSYCREDPAGMTSNIQLLLVAVYEMLCCLLLQAWPEAGCC
jgi:hypothetical protein